MLTIVAVGRMRNRAMRQLADDYLERCARAGLRVRVEEDWERRHADALLLFPDLFTHNVYALDDVGRWGLAQTLAGGGAADPRGGR